LILRPTDLLHPVDAISIQHFLHGEVQCVMVLGAAPVRTIRVWVLQFSSSVFL